MTGSIIIYSGGNGGGGKETPFSPDLITQMARTKQTARKGSGVPAPRKPAVPQPVSHRQREKEYDLMLKSWRQELREEKEEEKKSPELLSQLAAIAKERELIAKVLSFLKRVGIEIEEAFSYQIGRAHV